MLDKIKKVVQHPEKIIGRMNMLGMFNWMDDNTYLKFLFRVNLKYRLNLKEPKTFNEKMQWLKLNNIHPEYSKVVDKYEVRNYVKELIGEQHLIPLLGVWDSPFDIDFDKLPNEFVLKCTHNSGGVIVCKNKSEFDEKKAIKQLNHLLKKKYYKQGREYPYKTVKPRVICEKFMDDGIGNLPNDYKIMCFNGKPQNIMVCSGRKNGHADYYFFNKEWNFLPYNKVDINLPSDFTLPKPRQLEKMWMLAEEISTQYIVSRIDFYEIKGKLYFGEITLFPASGMDKDITKETDIEWGKKIRLPL
ncbi:MAG: ATP-grasp fold amidoligase family protein [Anaerostipes sp.]|nr:ATP-grasp fold amidoligase family protein [Anaerostipes sp.]